MMGVSKKSISKFLIGNRLHVKVLVAFVIRMIGLLPLGSRLTQTSGDGRRRLMWRSEKSTETDYKQNWIQQLYKNV